MEKAATVQFINPAIQRAQYLRAVALVLDTETTGSNRQNDEVIELGVVRASDGEVLVDQRFRPSKRIEPGAYRVHGIGERQLAGAPRFESRWPEYRALLDGAVVVGWNVAYDRQMLEATCAKYELSFPAVEWVDLMPLYRDFRRADKNCKLSVACEALGVRGGDHSAKADALATARVLYKMAGTEKAEAARPAKDELFEPTVTHEWEISELEDYYTEDYSEDEEEDEAPAVVLADQRLGTADASLREDGSIHIPMDARPVLCWWLHGSQTLWATLAELNAPLRSWKRYARKELALSQVCHGCKAETAQGDGFLFCAPCGFYKETS